MENKKTVSRKKFLSWGLVFSSILAVPSALFLGKKKQSADKSTAKLLTQDGKLVEIDIKNLPSSQVKIKDRDIHHWIRNKKKL